MKNLIDMSYLHYRNGVLIKKIKLNTDTVINEILNKFPQLNSTLPHLKIIKEDIAAKPQLNWLLYDEKSTKYICFLNLLLIDKYDSIIAKDYIMKKVQAMMIIDSVNNKDYIILDTKQLLNEGYAINEYNNFVLDSNKIYMGIAQKNGDIDTTIFFTAKYNYDNKPNPTMNFEKILNFKLPKSYITNHNSFTNSRLLGDINYIMLPFSGDLFDAKNELIYKSPFSDEVMKNVNPNAMTFGIWDSKTSKNINYFIYSISNKIYIGFYNLKDATFTFKHFDEEYDGMPSLTIIKEKLYIVYYQSKSSELVYKKLD